MKHLQFKVNSQTLKRLDSFKPAAGSVNYLTASFEFSEDWSGTTKTAKCRKDNEIYSAAINSSGVCFIPHEALTQDKAKRAFGEQEFYISVEGVDGSKTITTAEIKIELSLTGAGEEANAGDPTPELYAQYIADVTAATKGNADTAAAAAASATASAASMMNNYANALKGKASGAVIRLNDVSPVEHFPIVKVRGKNLLNYEVFRTVGANHGNVSFDNEGVVTLTATEDDCYTQYSNFPAAARVYVNEGETITLTWETDATETLTSGLVYLFSNGEAANFKSATATSKKITYTVPESCKFLVFRLGVSLAGKTIKYWNLQIEKGETATEYTPHINPATITISRLGKNLLQPRNNNGAGYTARINTDGSITVTGAANTTNPIYLTIATPTESEPLRLKAGQAYKMQSWSNNGKNINVKLMNDNGEAAWTSPSAWGTYLENGYLNLVQIYIESTKHEIGDASLVGTYRFMLEAGDVATDYEAYKEAAEYTPNTDGTIDGLTSISPTMTLLSDHEGVTIDCEYNRDINKAFARLEALLSN